MRVSLEKPFCAAGHQTEDDNSQQKAPPHTMQPAALPVRNLWDTSVIHFHSYCQDRQGRAAWAKLCTLKQRVVQGAPCPKGCRAAAFLEVLRKIKLDTRIEVSVRREVSSSKEYQWYYFKSKYSWLPLNVWEITAGCDLHRRGAVAST